MPKFENVTKNLLTTLLLAGLGLLTAASPVLAGEFSFNPATDELLEGCDSVINIMVDPEGDISNAADIEIYYDPTEVIIHDSISSIPGTQIKHGNAYEAYFGNIVDNSTGTILLGAGSFVGTLTTEMIFATIEFEGRPGVTQTDFTIRFDGAGATLDSNIAEAVTSDDLLTSVVHGTYTFTTGPCVADIVPPPINFQDPTGGSTGVPGDKTVTINITDNQSGVDLDTLEIWINGELYLATDPEVTITGNPLNYVVVIEPRIPLPEDEASVIRVYTEDFAGNVSNRQIVFNVPDAPTPAPPEPEECICECDIGESLTQLLINKGNVDIFEGGPLEGTAIDTFVNDLGFSGLAALIAAFAWALGLLPFLNLLNLPALLLNLIGILLRRTRGRPWGIVMDSVTERPIPFATCRLYTSETKSVVNQTVSDTEGRYGFPIGSGNYRLEVTMTNYTKFQREIRIPEGETGFVYDIKLSPREHDAEDERSRAEKYWDAFVMWYFKIRPYLFVAGFTLSILALVISPTIFNILIFIGYIILGIFYLLSAIARWRRSKNAAVVDSESNLRLPNANVKIFDINTNELIETQLTTNLGQFDYWGEPGEYGILVALRGYTFPSKKQPGGFKVIERELFSLLKVKLEKGNNKIQLYMDPLVENKTNIDTIEGGKKHADVKKINESPKTTGESKDKSTTSEVQPPAEPQQTTPPPPPSAGNLATPFG